MLYDDGRFEWDTDKDALNQRKHGVSFAVAKLAFDDLEYILQADRIDEATGEERWHLIGAADRALLLVVHAYRVKKDGSERTRILSAWPADGADRRRYSRRGD